MAQIGLNFKLFVKEHGLLGEREVGHDGKKKWPCWKQQKKEEFQNSPYLDGY